MLGLVAAGGLVWRGVPGKQHDVRRGWNPRRVLVLSRDLDAGMVLAPDAVAEATVPEQFITDSAVDPGDRAIVVGQKPGFPQQKGDVLVWGAFVQPLSRSPVGECLEKIREGASASADAAANGAIDDFERRATPLPPPSPVPALPVPDSTGTIAVVFAAQDVKEGETLASGQLSVRQVPAEFVTLSNIPGGQLAAIPGARLIVPVQKGDPLLWQQLDDAKVPRSAQLCISLANEAGLPARKLKAAELAKNFVAAIRERK